jgi:hypothetical protein
MTNPKRHHYVPRFILANFVDDVGKLWVTRVSGGNVWSAKPDDVYVEGHRYSWLTKDGSRDSELEQAYSVLEGETVPVVAEFLRAARARCSPVLTAAAMDTWTEFLYHQMKRVPAVTYALVRTRSWEARLELAIGALRDRGITVGEDKLTDLRSPDGLARLFQNATVGALLADAPPIRQLLASATVELGLAPVGSSFLIGSHPIAGVRSGIEGAPQLSTDMWLPIASNVAVKVAFGGKARTVALTAEKVASINRDSCLQSEYVAGSSRELVGAVSNAVATASAKPGGPH